MTQPIPTPGYYWYRVGQAGWDIVRVFAYRDMDPTHLAVMFHGTDHVTALEDMPTEAIWERIQDHDTSKAFPA